MQNTTYHKASSADDAAAKLAAAEDGTLLAGGQTLIPTMKQRLAAPSDLIDISGVDDIRQIMVRPPSSVVIGAAVTHAEVASSAELREVCPSICDLAAHIGDPAVRHRGTLGGSLAHADPASDLPAAAIALRATLVARGPQGDREIGIDDFFTGFLESALAPDELLTEVRVPVSTGGWAYEKFNRRAQDWAIVAAAVAEGGSGVALVNMGATPLRAAGVEAAIASGASAADAAAAAADGTSPPTDNNGDADYRSHLARVLTGRALATAGA